jgi:hypothetical protein
MEQNQECIYNHERGVIRFAYTMRGWMVPHGYLQAGELEENSSCSVQEAGSLRRERSMVQPQPEAETWKPQESH